MLKDYLLQDYAITHTMAIGYRPGDEWEQTYCSCCGEPLTVDDPYDSFRENQLCQECYRLHYYEEED